MILSSGTTLRGPGNFVNPNVGGPIVIDSVTEFEAAIAEAEDGDTILLAGGHFYMNGTITFGDRDLHIIGSTDPLTGAPTTIIHPVSDSRTFTLTNGQSAATIIENIIIDGSNANPAGGIYMMNTANPGPQLINCIIRNCNWIDHGAALRLNNAHPTLTNCTIESCSSPADEYHGAAIYLFGGASVGAADCTIRQNLANSGGAIYADQSTSVLLTACVLEDNTSTRYGGGAHIRQGATISTNNCTFTGNTTSTTGCSGGGIFSYGGSMTLIDTTFTSNTGHHHGGGVAAWHAGGTHLISNCNFNDNQTLDSNSSGGGLYLNSCTLDGADNIFSGNNSQDGGGAYLAAGVTIADGQLDRWNFTNNIVSVTPGAGGTNIGGGLFLNGVSTTLIDCDFTGNASADYAGGLMINSTSNCTLELCDFTENTADRTGGALYIDSSTSITLHGAVIDQNSAPNRGGGIHLWNSSPTILNSFVLGNHSAIGGGISSYGSSNPVISYSRICDNTVDQINGAFVDGGGNCMSEVCDTDSDGAFDCVDGCPDDPDKIEEGQCGCGIADDDSDGDGTLDCNDAFPDDPDETTDSDGDGVGDNSDAFPDDPDETTDSDGDGVGDNSDGCPDDPDKIEEGQCGCGNPETDTDGDGIPDCIDCVDPDDPNDGIHAYPCEYTSIQAAIIAAAPGDIVLIDAGTHELDDTIDTLGKAITIRGELDAGNTPVSIIDGQGMQVISCQAGAPGTVFENLIIQNGNAFIGAGMHLNTGSNITMDRCIIRNNTASSIGLGAGFSADGGTTAMLSNCVIEDNTSTLYAGGFYTSGTVTLQDCLIQNNAAPNGGGIYNDGGDVSLTGTTVCGNTPDNIAGSGTVNDLGGNCIMLACDDDTDGDGTLDCVDGCPDDPNKIEEGQCGCGNPETDSDADGTADCIDGCPDDPDKIEAGECGCGTPETDTDGDGIPDCIDDPCPADLDDDHDVDVIDLLGLIAVWGPCNSGEPCPADFNGSGDVDVIDLLQLIALWGECPGDHVFTGCTDAADFNESDYGCACFADGDDALTDCNPGLNGDGTMTPYELGDTICGQASVYADISGGTYRDTDWWDVDGMLDDGGIFSLKIGSGAAQLLGIVDLDAMAFSDYVINESGLYTPRTDVQLNPGTYCIWIAPSDWNTDWTCASGLADYMFTVDD